MHHVEVAARSGADDGGFREVFGTFGLTIPASKTETICMPIPRAPTAQVVFNATGQQYRQTTSFTYLGGTVTGTPNLSDEIDRRIRAGWMSLKRYTRKLYDRHMDPPDGPLHQASYNTPYMILLRNLGAWRKSTIKRILSNKDALQRTECGSIETTARTRRSLWSGALLRMGDHRLPKSVMSGELENAGKRGPRGNEKEWTDCVAEDLRLFGITGDWTTV